VNYNYAGHEADPLGSMAVAKEEDDKNRYRAYKELKACELTNTLPNMHFCSKRSS